LRCKGFLPAEAGFENLIPPSMYYTYVLKNREHQKECRCFLVYYEAYQSEKLARDRERKLKYYGSAWRALRKRIEA